MLQIGDAKVINGRIRVDNPTGDTDEVCQWVYSAFKQHRGNLDTFIETGTCTGGGINSALSVGFTKLHSIEINEQLYSTSVARWKHKPNVTLYFGNSVDIFPNLLSKITCPSFFWLDSHLTTSEYTYGELEIIKKHPIKTHTILIDDISLYFNKSQVEIAILEINPNYKISYEPTWRSNEEILVAKIV